MSLFVGNVSKHVSHRQLETLFKSYGKCRIDLRDRYAFVQFQNDNHAQNAKKQLQHQGFHGLQLNIQWSKNSGRFGQNKGGRKQGQRKRSRSRQNRWRRDDRWTRRSPSYQRRSSPSYSGNKDIQTFTPQCPRDQIILKKLINKKQSRRNRDHNNNSSHTNLINHNNNVDQQQKQIKEQKNQSHINNENDDNKVNSHIQQENRIMDAQDGQIPTHKNQ